MWLAHIALKRIFGLTDMPADFQKSNDSSLTGLINNFCFCMILRRGCIEDHWQVVRKFLIKSEGEILRTNTAKCNSLRKNPKWMVWKPNQTMGITPFANKIAAIQQLKLSTNIKKYKIFYGLCSSSLSTYTKFTPTLPTLTTLIKKNTKINWIDEHERHLHPNKKNLLRLQKTKL